MAQKLTVEGGLLSTALVLQDGGMRNAFTIGFLAGAEIRNDSIDAIFAPASAAVASMYFMCGQLPEAERLWTETLADHPAFSWRRTQDSHQPLDMDSLIELCSSPILLEDWRAARPVLHVPAGHGPDRRLVFLRSDETDPRRLAEGALDPDRLFRNGSLSGERLAEGDLVVGKYLYEAERLGHARNILVLLFSDVYPHLHTGSSTKRYVVRPSKDLPAGRFSRSRDEVRETIESGRALGREIKSDIQTFLAA